LPASTIPAPNIIPIPQAAIPVAVIPIVADSDGCRTTLRQGDVMVRREWLVVGWVEARRGRGVAVGIGPTLGVDTVGPGSVSHCGGDSAPVSLSGLVSQLSHQLYAD
jgi:hypothetical protein